MCVPAHWRQLFWRHPVALAADGDSWTWRSRRFSTCLSIAYLFHDDYVSEADEHRSDQKGSEDMHIFAYIHS